MFSDTNTYDPRHVIYDIECYPMVFTVCIYYCELGEYSEFEFSYRKDDSADLHNVLRLLKASNAVLIGFNNVGYDYPLLHFFMKNYPNVTPMDMYNESMRIINTPWDQRFNNIIWEDQRYIDQIDLFMIHHFDNAAKSTSLKQIEFVQRSHNIQDLPYEPGSVLTPEQIDNLILYNKFDVDKTFELYKASVPMIEFREGLSQKYDTNMMNHNDTKIGKDIMIHTLGRDVCFNRDGSKKQTPRDKIHLCDALFRYIEFRHPEFQRVQQWLTQQVITETKGVFTDLTAVVDGLPYVFGMGGLHASVPGQTVHSNHEYVVVDVDVTSYYPSLGIVNQIYPEHLGETYPQAVSQLKQERLQHKKGTLENAAYKLALNSGFGNSNNKYTPFYDPLYTMKITINGQLLLCMLAEWLLYVDDLKIIQCNTDGITYRCKRTDLERTRVIYHEWEKFTLLDLEEAIYSSMFIRDVNNYIAVYDGGGVKRKGAYEYNRELHQNNSSLVVAKAVEAHLLHFTDIREFIVNHPDDFDFFIFVKSGANDVLALGDRQLQRRSRYYISNRGHTLNITRPPTGTLGHYKKNNNTSKAVYNAADNSVWNADIHTKNQSVHAARVTDVEAGWMCTEVNDYSTFDRGNLNYEYYIQEAQKLVDAVAGC